MFTLTENTSSNYDVIMFFVAQQWKLTKRLPSHPLYVLIANEQKHRRKGRFYSQLDVKVVPDTEHDLNLKMFSLAKPSLP
jgi:hypothetical protein